ncbi:MAG: acylphosphatase [Puniceicoccales bacterium]|jgi:acylphosphatase|nr:acylphosphatase [Puniceicoccales bacterium]
MPSEVFHRDVWFGGHVQGVGFRASVLHVARAFEVTGKVGNLVDGRVFLQVEGTEREVQDFVAEVRRQLAFYIRDVEVRDFWGRPCFTDFTMR